MIMAQRLDWIQVLRAFAAILIVLGHAQTSAMQYQPDFKRILFFNTGAGVDLFFIISGFIMVYVSRSLFQKNDPCLSFFSRRIARVVPLYWLITAIYIVLTTAKGNLSYSWGALFASFFFIPYDVIEANNGLAFPIYNLGWTLNYEMFFYFIFGSCLALGPKFAVHVTIVVLSCLAVAGMVFEIENTALRFWTQPILLEFCLGMVIALVHGTGWSMPSTFRLLLVLGSFLMIAFQPLSALMPSIEGTTPNSLIRVLALGLPMAAVVAAAVLCKRSTTSRLLLLMKPLGDASYSMYLVHPLIIIALWKMPGLGSVLSGIPTIAFLIIVLICTIFGSIVSFHLIERSSAALVASYISRFRSMVREKPAIADVKENNQK